MGVRSLQIFLLSQCRNRLQTSESDVCRRQILTSKVDSRTLRVKKRLCIVCFNGEVTWSPIHHTVYISVGVFGFFMYKTVQVSGVFLLAQVFQASHGR